MKTIHYLRGCAFLPIILPILMIPFNRLNIDPMEITNLFLSSLFVGGIPYSVFAIVSLLLLWRSPASSYWWFGRLAPLIFTGFFWIVLAVYLFVEEGRLAMGEIWIAFLVFGFTIVLLGYSYVFLAWIGYRLLLHRKLIKDA